MAKKARSTIHFDEMVQLLDRIHECLYGFRCDQAAGALMSALIDVEMEARECSALLAIKAIQLTFSDMEARMEN